MATNKTSFSDYIAGQKASGEQFWAVLQTMGIPNGALLIPLDAEDRDGRTFLAGLAASHVPGLPIKFQATSNSDAFTPNETWRFRIDGPGAPLTRKVGVLSRIDSPYPVFTGTMDALLVEFSITLMRIPTPKLRRPWVMSLEVLGDELDA